MTFAAGIVLIALGAILRFATDDLVTIGLVLMIVGAFGLLLGIWQWTLWSRGSRREEAE
jgi:hypothetical protein